MMLRICLSLDCYEVLLDNCVERASTAYRALLAGRRVGKDVIVRCSEQEADILRKTFERYSPMDRRVEIAISDAYTEALR
jgi:hypothetical protein